MTATAPLPGSANEVLVEAARRRTFAIISHPDAGKTTLTEKFLLYAGAVQRAGAVKAREGRRAATSDWMELERQRGISISSTVLQFPYRDHVVNLLDTPGHKDFSEDTYRVLAGVDAVVMVLDSAKGIEAQTLKLFEVCRARRLPVLTFLNKYDRPGREPLELLDEIEAQIGLRPTPATWPVGPAGELRGVIDRRTGTYIRYARTERGASLAPEQIVDFADAAAAEGTHWQTAVDELALLDAVGADVDVGVVPRRRLDPGLRRIGADQLRRADDPRRRHRSGARTVAAAHRGRRGEAARCRLLGVRVQGPGEHGSVPPRPIGVRPDLLGPLRPRHDRDVCAYRPGTDDEVRDDRLRRRTRDGRGRLSRRRRRPRQRNRPATRRHRPRGGRGVTYPPIPRFSPEVFATARPLDTGRAKQFRKGIEQLDEEGVVQVLRDLDHDETAPILAAVGALQFDVFSHRLAGEFGAPAEILPAGYQAIRRTDAESLPRLRDIGGIRVLRRSDGAIVALFENRYRLARLEQDEPELTLEPLVAGAVPAF